MVRCLLGTQKWYDSPVVNSSPPGQFVGEIADIFWWIIRNENIWSYIEKPIKFVPKGAIDKSALIQVMARWRPGEKPLPEPMLTYCQLDPKDQT